MICSICNCLVKSKDKKRLIVQSKEYLVHKSCLRKATKTQLIEKGLIKPGDLGWWAEVR